MRQEGGRWDTPRSPSGQAVEGVGMGLGMGRAASKMKPGLSGSWGYGRATPETGNERGSRFATEC